MTQTFVPFLQATHAGAVSHQPERAAFAGTSLEDSLRASQEPGSHLPRCEVKKEGDRIIEIRIYCNCGEVVQLKCEY